MRENLNVLLYKYPFTIVRTLNEVLLHLSLQSLKRLPRLPGIQLPTTGPTTDKPPNNVIIDIQIHKFLFNFLREWRPLYISFFLCCFLFQFRKKFFHFSYYFYFFNF